MEDPMTALKRMEEKQKLANLQIDKRLSELEGLVEELASEFESLRVPKGNLEKREKEDVSEIRAEIGRLRSERRAELQQIVALVQSVDIASITGSVKELTKSFERFKGDVGMKMQGMELLQPSNDVYKGHDLSEDVRIASQQVKLISDKLDLLKKRMDRLEKSILHTSYANAVVLE